MINICAVIEILCRLFVFIFSSYRMTGQKVLKAQMSACNCWKTL